MNWRKARSSMANGACVEVGTATGLVAARDSGDRAGRELRFSAAVWRAFIARSRSCDPV